MSNAFSCSVLGDAPMCQRRDFMVEVHGKNHPAGQKLVVYEKTGSEPIGINPRPPGGTRDTSGLNKRPSVMHIWPWKGQPPSCLVLEVDAEEGPAIQFPLLDKPEESSIWDEEIAHVMVPVVPMDWVRGMTIDGINHLTWPVLARTGFLYLFRDNRLWRELQVCWNDGQIAFRDIRLSDHCDAEGKVVHDKRPVAGKALPEIWVPLRLDHQEQSLEMAFAESPLPAARLNRIREDFSLRHYRCQQVQKMKIWDQPSAGFATGLVPRNRPVFYLDKISAQRPRDPAREWQFDLPWHYLENLPGDYAANAYSKARGVFREYEKNLRTTPLATCEKPEPGAWGLCIQQAIQEKDRPDPTPFAKSDWKVDTKATDALADLRERGVCGLKIDDRLYQLRHQQSRIHTARHLLTLCSLRARQNPQLESARLLNQIVLPFNLNEQRNPLSRFSQALAPKGRQLIDRILMTEERTLGREYLEAAQDELLLCLKRQPYQQVLGDLFSSNGFDYAAAFRCTGRFISDVLEPALKQDPLHPEQGLPSPDTDAKQWLRSLCTESAATSQSRDEVSLARMLWPQLDTKQQKTPYTPPENPADNPGDGVFRGHALAVLEQQDLPEDITDIVTLDGLQLAKDIQSGTLNTLMLAGLASGMKALDAAHNKLHDAIRSAQTALENNDRDLKHLRQQYHNLAQRQADLTARYEKKARQALEALSDDYLTILSEARRAQTEFEKTREQTQKQLAKAQEIINQRFLARRMALMSHPVEALRQSMPTALPGLRLMPMSDAIGAGKYILGLEDLSGNGDRVTPATDKAGRILVWVLNRDKPATEAISKLSQAQNQLILARKAREQATTHRGTAEAQLAQARKRYNNVTAELDAIGGRASTVMAAIKATEKNTEPYLAKLEGAENSRFYGILNTPALPAAVLGLEAVNVWNIYTGLSATLRTRGQVRAGAGIVSATYNTALASMLLAERFANSFVAEKSTRFLSYRFKGDAANALAKTFRAEALTMRMFLGGLSGLAVTGISLADTLYALDTGDPAAWGYAVSTAGGVAATLAALVPAEALLLGMGPLGWIGLGLMLGGTYLVMSFQDEPIESWLRNGPFGDQDGLPHLIGDENAAEAYFRLVGLLSNVRLEKKALPLTTSARQALFDGVNASSDIDLSKATHEIRVDSNVPGLLDAYSIEKAVCELRLIKKVVSRNGRSGTTQKTSPVPEAAEQNAIIFRQSTDTGYRVFVQTPESHLEIRKTLKITTGQYDVSYSWQAKAQYQVSLKGEPFAFPAPLPKDTTRYDKDNNAYTQPDFSDDDQLYCINGFSKPKSL